MFNLIAASRPADEVLQEIAEYVVSEVGETKEAGR
jgi:hypothetical protein